MVRINGKIACNIAPIPPIKSRLLIGGIGAILHAIFPFILTTIASDTINDLHKMNVNRLNSDD